MTQYEGDYLGNGYFGYYNHNGMEFTTFDQDNDPYYTNCAETRGGAWWYNSCFWACLMCESAQSIWWSLPEHYIVKSRMMIKPQ